MSQAGILNVSDSNPAIPTSFATDSGTGTPSGNSLTIAGDGAGISTSGSGSTVTVTFSASGVGTIPTSFVTDSGTATPSSNVVQVLGLNDTSTSATGNIIYVSSTGSEGGGGDTIIGQGWNLIETQEITSSTAAMDFEDFIDDDNYDNYIMLISYAVPVSDGDELTIRVGTGATPTYDMGNSYSWTGYVNFGVGSSGSVVSEIRIGDGCGNDTSQNEFGYCGNVKIFRPSDTSVYKRFNYEGSYIDTGASATGGESMFYGVGVYETLTAVTALRLYFDSGNILQMKASLYGIYK